MKPFENIPRVNIAHTPTPLEHLPNLSAQLGCNLYVKRDDCTGLAVGGNKTRKLEYLIADAQQQGADTLVTIGGIQSNHARQTAAAAAKFGFACELVLQDVAGVPQVDYYHSGNVLLDQLCGATQHRLTIDDDEQVYAQQLMAKLISTGKKPYLIPIGGSNVIGAYGYMYCANELLAQLDTQNLQISQITLATGSAGTQAGLLAGLIEADRDITVLGISVNHPVQKLQPVVEGLLRDILTSRGINPNKAAGKVHINSDYYGEGYGIASDSMVKAVKQCAQHEGLLLDPVYSGKAMAGLMDLCAKGVIKPDSNQLFLHTGGSPGLFAYREVF